MCIGIPMQIVESADDVAVCEGRGARALERHPRHRGRLQPVAAQRPTGVEFAAAPQSGEHALLDAQRRHAGDLDRHLALAQHLVGDDPRLGREPELPAHLRGPR